MNFMTVFVYFTFLKRFILFIILYFDVCIRAFKNSLSIKEVIN